MTDHGTQTSPANSPSQRLAFIDAAKAIGIVLVAFGHAPAVSDSVDAFIFSFHMPLFFFISGYLLSAKKLVLPIRDYVRLQASSLLIPYLFYFAIAFAFWCLMKPFRPHDPGTYEQAATGILWGYGDALIVDTPLWFFASLFVTSILFHLLRKRVNSITALLLGLMVSVIAMSIFPLPWGRLPWSIENSLVAIFYYSLGTVARSSSAWLRPVPKAASLFSAIALFVLLLAGNAWNGRVDLNGLIFGPFRALYVLNALAGIGMTLCIAALFPPNRLLTWLSESTVVIFPMHGLIFYCLNAVGQIIFKMPREFQEKHWGWSIVYTVTALIACWPLTWILSRIAPVASGLRTRRQTSPVTTTSEDLKNLRTTAEQI